ncbi:MAG: cytochrome c-type biogenesis protein [Pseudomonadota bacterium]
MRFFLLALGFVMATPVWAVEPDEILSDPELEARARVISADLRCLVCRNESIDDSQAELAKDMRILVRERLLEGDSNADVLAFMVARYGEYVRLTPQTTGSTWILWGAGPAVFVLALIGALGYVRRCKPAPALDDAALSEEEKARLAALLEADAAPKTPVDR